MSLPMAGSPEQVSRQLREAIEAALPGAQVQVTPTSPGHFGIQVIAEAFRGQTRLAQHQAVYAAITPLMQGEDAPVHAVDRLETRLP